MNKCNIEFLRRNGIDIEKVNRSVDTHIYTTTEKNEIVGAYGFQGNQSVRNVSVADIVGYDSNYMGIVPNIFASLDGFFDEHGDGYHTRSLGMLQYGKDDIIEKLQSSFKWEPISLIETGEGEYTVLSNGLHRTTILRTLYLSEAAEAQGNQEELERIAKKYTIPAKVREVDLQKTYCKYLLMKAWAKNPNQDVLRVTMDFDEYCIRTGKVVVEYYTREKQILNDDELLALTRQRISESVNFENLLQMFQAQYNKYKSFREFMDKNFADIMPMQKQEIKERGQI